MQYSVASFTPHSAHASLPCLPRGTWRNSSSSSSCGTIHSAALLPHRHAPASMSPQAAARTKCAAASSAREHSAPYAVSRERHSGVNTSMMFHRRRRRHASELCLASSTVALVVISLRSPACSKTSAEVFRCSGETSADATCIQMKRSRKE